jgi:KDO2-lipid IV(A) lauroyltransferase
MLGPRDSLNFQSYLIEFKTSDGRDLYTLLSLIARLIGLLPDAALSFAAKLLGIFMFDVLRLRRRLILQNISTAFPDLPTQQAKELGRKSAAHLVTTFLELFWVWTRSMNGRFSIVHPEILESALKRGQGVYVLCTHTGNFEVLATALGKRFAKVTSPVKRIGASAGVNRFIAENRARQGIDAIVRKKKGEGFLAIRAALQENRIVGFMMDQARPGEPRVLLFGKPAKTNTSLGAIWDRCQAPLIPAYCERVGFARHVIHILPEVTFPPGVNAETDILNRARACNTIVEDIVRRCPEQYWWVHDRWK